MWYTDNIQDALLSNRITELEYALSHARDRIKLLEHAPTIAATIKEAQDLGLVNIKQDYKPAIDADGAVLLLDDYWIRLTDLQQRILGFKAKKYDEQKACKCD